MMKKIVLTNGIISGVIVTAFMVFSSISCYNDPNFESSMLLGYTGMLLAFAFVFIGIKQFRDKVNNVVISYWKAFQIGGLIALIGSTFYVLTWLVEFYAFMPDFMEKYTVHVLKAAQEAGASATELEHQKLEMASYADLYKSPIGVILLTYMEILPIGILVTLISAFVLKRKEKK